MMRWRFILLIAIMVAGVTVIGHGDGFWPGPVGGALVGLATAWLWLEATYNRR